MSFEEKGTWVYLVVNVVTYAAYLSIILGRAENIPLTEVSYVSTMLWTIGIAIALSIFGHIAVAIAKPSEADKRDVRDKDINRFGEYVGGIVLAVGTLVPFGLAMAEVAHFWIANAIYLAFVQSALTASVVKIVAYRRGL
ncbi:MAG: hypothetical protein ACRDFR_03670 [Candidatus Limnocylindria bacterium]